MNISDFFHVDDPHTRKWEGHNLPAGGWSRHYEYPWAIQWARPHMTVMDAGTGQVFSPFRYVLADKCREGIAVDTKEPEDVKNWPQNLSFTDADLAGPGSDIFDYFDAIFCINVLPEVDRIGMVLKNFAQWLKTGGIAVLTFDVQYEMDKPLGAPGVDILDFHRAAMDAKLKHQEENYWGSKENALHHPVFNLCIYHAVLKK